MPPDSLLWGNRYFCDVVTAQTSGALQFQVRGDGRKLRRPGPWDPPIIFLLRRLWLKAVHPLRRPVSRPAARGSAFLDRLANAEAVLAMGSEPNPQDHQCQDAAAGELTGDIRGRSVLEQLAVDSVNNDALPEQQRIRDCQQQGIKAHSNPAPRSARAIIHLLQAPRLTCPTRLRRQAELAALLQLAEEMFPEARGAPKAAPVVGAAAPFINAMIVNSKGAADELWKRRGYDPKTPDVTN